MSSDKIRTTTIIGKCPNCGGDVVETKYKPHVISCEMPEPECVACNREVGAAEVK